MNGYKILNYTFIIYQLRCLYIELLNQTVFKYKNVLNRGGIQLQFFDHLNNCLTRTGDFHFLTL